MNADGFDEKIQFDAAINSTYSNSLSDSPVDGIQHDYEVSPFFAEWLKNGMNASQAYKTLHPSVTDESARVLGSRQLTKVNKPALLEAFGVGVSDFFIQIKEGLSANKFNEFTGEKVPDYRVRLEYVKIVGKLLGTLS